MTRKLFHITNSSVIFGCLVGLVCYHQCHRHTWSLGLSYLSSTKFTFIVVAWFILFVINQVHRHTWLLGFSCLLSPMPPSYLVAWFILFAIYQFHHHIWLFSVFPTGMNTSVQVYLKQCWPLMLSSSVGSSGSL